MDECIIKANCPVCLASCEDIVYQNSGPIVRIYCSKCGVVYCQTANCGRHKLRIDFGSFALSDCAA